MKRSLMILLLITFGLDVLAADPVVERFRQSALNAITKAEKLGITEIDGIQLQDMKTAAQNTVIAHDSRLTIRFVNRRCAMWQPFTPNVHEIGTGKIVSISAHIFLNQECASIPEEELGGLALHEILGVNFQRDRNYEISTQILSGKPVSNKNENIQWRNNRKKIFQFNTSGGSTGVGGGGDTADIRFKLEGVRVLNELANEKNEVFGIPKDVLYEALLHMSVSPASNVTSLMEFRARELEGNAIIYVKSIFYRSKTADNLGLWAVYAARLFVLYAPYDIGLVEDAHESLNFDINHLIKPDEITLKAINFIDDYVYVRLHR